MAFSDQEEVVAADTRMGEWLWKCTQAAAAAQAWPGDLMPQLDWGNTHQISKRKETRKHHKQ